MLVDKKHFSTCGYEGAGEASDAADDQRSAQGFSAAKASHSLPGENVRRRLHQADENKVQVLVVGAGQ